MNLKSKKDKLLLHLEQEKFRKELKGEEYSCYHVDQKKKIMEAIKKTNWDLPRIREIFQSKQVKLCIDKFLYMFYLLSLENEAISCLSWDMICVITNNLDKEIRDDYAVFILQEFANAPTMENYQKIRLLAESCVKPEGLISSREFTLLKSALNSTEVGYKIGEKLNYLFNIAYNAMFYIESKSSKYRWNYNESDYFKLVNKVYRGIFDSHPVFCEIIEDMHAEVEKLSNQQLMFQGSDEEFWNIDEHIEMFNRIDTMFETLSNEALRIEYKEQEAPSAPKM